MCSPLNLLYTCPFQANPQQCQRVSLNLKKETPRHLRERHNVIHTCSGQLCPGVSLFLLIIQNLKKETPRQIRKRHNVLSLLLCRQTCSSVQVQGTVLFSRLMHTARNTRCNTRCKQPCMHIAYEAPCKFLTLWCHSYRFPGLSTILSKIFILKQVKFVLQWHQISLKVGMKLNLLTEFIDAVSRRAELFDISHDLYSNNEHRRFCFHQIGLSFNVDGENTYL